MPLQGLLGPPGGQPAAGPSTTAGAVAGAPAGQPQGVCIAFNDPWNAVNPTWTRIDDPAGVWVVTSWSIDRGRSYELDKTATGTATVTVADTQGLLDPTNSTSPYYGLIEPLKQACINLQNPVTGNWTTVFRGFIEDWDYTLDVSENVMFLELRLVDALELLAATEVIPGQHGVTPPSGSGVAGDVLYVSQQVDDRIKAALLDAHWDPTFQVIFSGNVSVQDTTYAPRSQILSVIQDAADAEWPGVANFFVAKDGRPTFHGRLARFNPSAYGIGSWRCGDTAAITADAGRAPIASLSFSRSLTQVINAALATPQGIKDADVAGQLSVDTASIATYGTRTWSAENLVTRRGDETGTPDMLAETKRFADYYRLNYASPRNRVSQVSFRPWPAGEATHGPTLWQVMCGVEIGDQMAVTTTHPGGGGFNEDPYFVEGVHYTATNLGGAGFTDVTLTVDLSPQAFFTQNPFN